MLLKVLPKVRGQGATGFVNRVFPRYRGFSSKPSPGNAAPQEKYRARLQRMNARFPKFIRHVTTPLLNAPFTHILSFLVLHEITAIVPLIGLASYFHYTNYLPPFFAEWKWVSEGVQRAGRYFRRKGWISEEEGQRLAHEQDQLPTNGKEASQSRRERLGKYWRYSEGGTRWIIEVGTAYAITKLLLPARILISVWGAPWFARWCVMPATRLVKRMGGFSGPSKI